MPATNRNFKQAFWASRKVPKNSPGGKRPLSGLNMKGFRLREGPHRSLCQVGCLGLPRIVAFEVRQRPRGIVGSGTEPDGSGSREGLRIGIIKGLFAWAGKCVWELSQGRPPLLESFGHSMTIGTCPENHAFMYLTSSTMQSRGNGRQDISFKCENQDHYLCRSNRE